MSLPPIDRPRAAFVPPARDSLLGASTRISSTGRSQAYSDVRERDVFKGKALELPGRLAALWAQRLPDPEECSRDLSVQRSASTPTLSASVDASNRVVDAVRRHLAAVDACLREKKPTQLEAALKDAQGTSFLKTAKEVRRVPTSHLVRHAGETALASHIVKANGFLHKWRLGLADIQEARMTRDAGILTERLAMWGFSEEEPTVQAARADLHRWARMKEALPQTLRQLLEKRDVGGLQVVLKDLREKGPRISNDVEGLSKAYKLVRLYNQQLKAVAMAVEEKHHQRIQDALASWKYDPEDPQLAAARGLADRGNALCARLRAAAKPRPRQRELQLLCDEWAEQFLDRPEEFEHAASLVKQSEEAAADVELLLVDKEAPVVSLRAKVEALDSLGGQAFESAHLAKAREKLDAFDASLRKAIESADAWLVDRLLSRNGGLASISSHDSHLTKAASQLLEGRNRRADEILRWVDAALGFDNDAVEELLRLAEDWPFAQTDPRLWQAQAWLHLRRYVAEAGEAELLRAARAGCSAMIVQESLRRRQGLAADAEAVGEVRRLLKLRAEAHNVACAMALGLPLEQVVAAHRSWAEEGLSEDAAPPPLPGTTIALAELPHVLPEPELIRSSLQGRTFGNVFLAGALAAALGEASLESLSSEVAKAREYLSTSIATADALGQQMRDEVLAQLAPRMQVCRATLEAALLQGGRAASTKLMPVPVVEAAACVLTNSPKGATCVGPHRLIPSVVKALEKMEAILADTDAELRRSEGGLSGRLPSSLGDLGRGTPLMCAPAATEAPDSLEWQFRAQVPLESTCEAVRILGMAPAKGRPAAAAIAGFVLIAQAFYEQFLTRCALLASATAAAQDASEALASAEEALAFGRSMCSSVEGKEESIVFGASWIVCPALAVSQAHAEARTECQRLLQLLAEGSAPQSAASRLAWTAEVLSAFVRPAEQLLEVLSQVAAGLVLEDIANMRPQQQGSLGALIKAVLPIVDACRLETSAEDKAAGDAGPQSLFADDSFKQTLVAWSPWRSFLHGDSLARVLESSRLMLLQLWPWFAEGHCDGSSSCQRLFVWAALATALGPLLDEVSVLVPPAASARILSDASAMGAKARSPDPAIAAWTSLCGELEAAGAAGEQPWWWLGRLGCTDPASYYERHLAACESDNVAAPLVPPFAIIEPPDAAAGVVGGLVDGAAGGSLSVRSPQTSARATIASSPPASLQETSDGFEQDGALGAGGWDDFEVEDSASASATAEAIAVMDLSPKFEVVDRQILMGLPSPTGSAHGQASSREPLLSVPQATPRIISKGEVTAVFSAFSQGSGKISLDLEALEAKLLLSRGNSKLSWNAESQLLSRGSSMIPLDLEGLAPSRGSSKLSSDAEQQLHSRGSTIGSWNVEALGAQLARLESPDGFGSDDVMSAASGRPVEVAEFSYTFEDSGAEPHVSITLKAAEFEQKTEGAEKAKVAILEDAKASDDSECLRAMALKTLHEHTMDGSLAVALGGNVEAPKAAEFEQKTKGAEEAQVTIDEDAKASDDSECLRAMALKTLRELTMDGSLAVALGSNDEAPKAAGFEQKTANAEEAKVAIDEDAKAAGFEQKTANAEEAKVAIDEDAKASDDPELLRAMALRTLREVAMDGSLAVALC